MDKAQALNSFWNSFSWQAIDEQSAYDESTLDQLEIEFPYITYEVATGEFGDQISIGCDLWDKSTTWSRVSQKADDISARISRGGIFVPYDGGAIWITRGSPFSQRMDAETSNDVRRIHININAEFLSA